MKLNNLVKEIIEENSISKQTEITDILLKQYNINVTQSNISRILKQIKAVKVVSNDKSIVYEIQEKLDDASNWVKRLVKKIDDNNNVIVINTYPGSANIVAKAIDEQKFKNILGTLAGDDTLCIIPKDVTKIRFLRAELEKMLFF